MDNNFKKQCTMLMIKVIRFIYLYKRGREKKYEESTYNRR